jgi:hypothetical protein
MRDQLREVERRAADTKFRVTNYSQQLQSVAHALMPNRFYEQWQNSLGFLSNDTLLALNMLADAIGEDEQGLPPDKIEALLTEIAVLEKEVRGSDLDVHLKEFVFMHLDSIRLALRSYPVVGARALQQAFRRAAWEWESNPLGREPTRQEKTVLQRVRRIAATVATFAAAAGATIHNTETLVSGVQAILRDVPKVATELGLKLPGVVPKQLSAPVTTDAEVAIDAAASD